MTEKPDGKLTFTYRIEVNNVPERTDLPPFCVEFFGQIIDMRDLAREVIADYPFPVGIDVETLAALCVKGHNGKYIKVKEYPVGFDRKIVDELRHRCARWLNWVHRRNQLREGGAFPQRQFQCGGDACEKARAENGAIIPALQQQRLPFNGCWGYLCTCDYALVQRDGTVL